MGYYGYRKVKSERRLKWEDRWDRIPTLVKIGVPVVALLALPFLLVNVIFSGYGYNHYFMWFFRNNFVPTTAFSILLAGFGGILVIFGLGINLESLQKHSTALYAVVALIALTSIGFTVKAGWDNDKDAARWYNQATVTVIDGKTSTTDRLLAGSTETTGDCEYETAHDVPSCIKNGKLPMDGWEARNGSLEGAKYAIGRSSGDTNKVSLNEDTLAFVNNRWTGILDGAGRFQGLGGIAEWSGSGEVNQCLFAGDYEADRAFAGERGNSLTNLLREKYPNVSYSMSDVYGYCDGDEPIVIIPTIRQEVFKSRSVTAFGGLITVRGDHGNVKLQFYKNPKPGQFEGGIYPASLVDKQIDSYSWAAGRKNRNAGFGLEPASSSAQSGNVKNYLLTNKKTGRIEWVTPLTLSSSSSELFVAYAVTPADEAASHELTELTIYMLGKDDPRRVNIDNLEADALNYLVENFGTFKSNGGKLVEFTPIDGNRWIAFGEINGRVVNKIEISADASIPTKIVQISPEGTTAEVEGKEPTKPKLDCGKPTGQMTIEELTTCSQNFITELGARGGAQD